MSTDTAEKMERLRSLLARDPNNVQLQKSCYTEAMAARDYAAALDFAQRVLAQTPGEVESRLDLANALIGLKQYQDALEQLRPLLEREPGILAVVQNVALCYFLLGQYASAQPYLAHIYESGQRSPDVLRLLIATYHHLGLIDEAVAIADENPDAGKADGNLAGAYSLLYLDSEDMRKAERYAARALAANPDSVDGLVVQGTARLAALEVATARAQFERALQVAPNTGRAMIGLGMLSLLQQDLPASRSHMENALQRIPDHSGSWVVMGWIQVLQGDVMGAKGTFERVVELDRSFGEGHGGLAVVAAFEGDSAECERLIETAERLDGECLGAKFARSILMRGAGDVEAARQLILTTLAGLSPQGGGPLAQLISDVVRR